MAFAGSSPYGIFSGAFNSRNQTIQWDAAGERGSSPACEASGVIDRGVELPAASREAHHTASGPPLNSASSGFRGLTCVPNLNGSGSMLIAALEGPGDIYDIPLDGSQPTIELHTANFIASQLGVWVGYDIAAYN
jgi:hypothetical protein